MTMPSPTSIPLPPAQSDRVTRQARAERAGTDRTGLFSRRTDGPGRRDVTRAQEIPRAAFPTFERSNPGQS